MRAVVLLVVLASRSWTLGSQDLPVPDIPTGLPSQQRAELAASRAALLDTIAAHNRRVAEFSGRCGPGKIPADAAALQRRCGDEFVALTAEQSSISTLKRRFVARLDSVTAGIRCGPAKAQVERDQDAIRRLQRTNETGLRELEQWTAEYRSARWTILVAGARGLLGEWAGHLESRQKSANAFKGWLTRYDKQLRENGVPIEALLPKIEGSLRGYNVALVQVKSGKAINTALELDALWEQFKTEAGVIASELAEADAEIRAAIDNPLLQRFLERDASAADLLRSSLDLAAMTRDAVKIAPHYALAAMLVDFGFEAKRWQESHERIVRQHALADTTLVAFRRLDEQLRRSVARLQQCRQAPPA